MRYRSKMMGKMEIKRIACCEPSSYWGWHWSGGWSASNSPSSSSSQASSSPNPNWIDISMLASRTRQQRTAEISLRSNRASSTVARLGIMSGFFGGRRWAKAYKDTSSQPFAMNPKIGLELLYRQFLTTVLLASPRQAQQTCHLSRRVVWTLACLLPSE